MIVSFKRCCAALAMCAACGGGDDPVPLPTAREACGYGEIDTGVGCCAPGTTPEVDGGCRAAGIPPSACGAGFVSNDSGGCDVVLPAESCAHGEMAIPGETTCRPVGPCGDGKWGEAPMEPTTQFVDGSYSGTSDGTDVAPWTTIAGAVSAAEPGAVVAIAAGTYIEDVLIAGKPVRLWGACPALVEIAGTGAAGPFSISTAVTIATAANGTELHDLSIVGAAAGLGLIGSRDVVVDRIWIHDTQFVGLVVSGELAETGLSLQNSLVERTVSSGIFVEGTGITVDATVVRDIERETSGAFGVGIMVQSDAAGRGGLSLARSIVERSYLVGVLAEGADVEIDASVVRDVKPGTVEPYGLGVSAQADPGGSGPTHLSLTRSLLERNATDGLVLAGASAMVEATTIRDTDGRGVSIQPHPNGEYSLASLIRCVVERSREAGVVAFAADVSILESIVRGVRINAAGTARAIHAGDSDIVGVSRGSNVLMRGTVITESEQVGVVVIGSSMTIETTEVARHSLRGVVVQNSRVSNDRGTLIMHDSSVRDNHGAGLFLAGSNAFLQNIVVRDTDIGADGTSRGLTVQADPLNGIRANLVLTDSLVEHNAEAGVFVLDADAIIEDSVIADSYANLHGLFGDGVVVASIASPSTNPSTLVLRNAHIANSARAGMSNFGSHATVERTTFECNTLQINEESAFQDVNRSPRFAGCLEAGFDACANDCGCGDERLACIIVSSGLQPPAPIE